MLLAALKSHRRGRRREIQEATVSLRRLAWMLQFHIFTLKKEQKIKTVLKDFLGGKGVFASLLSAFAKGLVKYCATSGLATED